MTYHPYTILGHDRPARWLVNCDHASNHVPNAVNGGDLGLPLEDMNRHIAYDIGAAGVSAALAERLNGPAILSQFSRLVIDPNRGEDDPTLVMRLNDGSIIPANRRVAASEIEHRLNLCHRPYHTAFAGLAAQRDNTVIVSLHSFTRQYKGRDARPWEIGVLYNHDTRFTDPLLDRLKLESDLTVGDNEPYTGRLPGDTMDRHALQFGRVHMLIELRNDLIETPQQQHAWADRLAPILQETLVQTGL